MVMLVGVFVHFTGALSVEGVQKGICYTTFQKVVKEYILVYLPVIELVFVCMIYSFTFISPVHLHTFIVHPCNTDRHKISILVCLPFLQYVDR